jgi:two-component system chemotaxis response regulator CheB
MIRVLIVDNSPTPRMLVRSILQNDPEITVVGEARTCAEAVMLCRNLMPDILTMDLQLLKLDGYQAIHRIMADMPRPIMVLTSNELDISSKDGERAVAAGALMVLGKPEGLSGEDAKADQLLALLKSLFDLKVVGRRKSLLSHTKSQVPSPTSDIHPNPNRVQIVAIGASTGGPHALLAILSKLPESFPVPLTVVQHISQGFVSVLTKWLNESTPLSVKVADIGETLKPATVYLAPDARHMMVTNGGRIWLTKDPPLNGHCPSATVLFRSVAERYGPSGIGVILTGMGGDGAIGLKSLHDRGGYTIAQDEASCIVFGMPKEAIALGSVDEVLPIGEISKRLIELVSGR